jgi:fructose/tagatose bisphosphate aldolase
MHPLVNDLSGKNTEDILKTMNDLYKKINFASRTGNAAMLGQLKNILETYKQEYEKRRMAEVKAAEQNPLFKDSLDIG